MKIQVHRTSEIKSGLAAIRSFQLTLGDFPFRFLPMLVLAYSLASCGDKSETDATAKEELPDRPQQITLRSRSSIISEEISDERTSVAGSHLEQRARYRERPQRTANSSIRDAVTIKQDAPVSDPPGYRHSPHELPVSLLPVWQREQISQVRSQRKAVYEQGKNEANKVLSLSPKERRAWTVNWLRKNKKQLADLRKMESKCVRSVAPVPTQDMILDLTSRLNGIDPILGEADLPTIEFLLPPVDQLETSSERKLDDQTLRLLEAHRILAARFPQSAFWRPSGFKIPTYYP